MKTRPDAENFAAAVAALFLLAAGCSGLSAGKHAPGVVEKDEFKPGRPPVASYGPDPSLTCPERGINGMVQEILGDSPAKPEGRLCALAETLLGWPGTDQDIPPESALAVLSHDFALPQPVRKRVITNANTAEDVARGPAIQGLSKQDLATSIA